jgi:hypothetical protein
MSTRLNTHDTSRIANKLRQSRLTFENSIIEFETGPVGVFARITRDDGRREYAGPLPDATIAALREVGSE